MKKILAFFLFLGIASTGFAQSKLEINFAGKAHLQVHGERQLLISCSGDGLCASIRSDNKGKVHLLIPSYEIDIILNSITVNSIPANILPPSMPNGSYNFEYELE